MYKIAILGCENSHANSFLKFIKEKDRYSDIEVCGIYSIDNEAAVKLGDEFGVNVMKSPDELVGKIDGLIITARHGGYHYKFANPYIKSGIPMFIDKPITISETDAAMLAAELKGANVRFCGGSSLKHSSELLELKKFAFSADSGKMLGGFMRAPVSLENPHGDFFFYAQHLVSMMTTVYGYFPQSVYAHKNGEIIDCIISYSGFNVHLSYVNGNYKYYACVSTEKGCFGADVTLDGVFEKEFSEFEGILRGTSEGDNIDEFFAPVFIMNAIERSVNSGACETINYDLNGKQ